MSIVHVTRGFVELPVLDGRQVNRISPYLVQGEFAGSPSALVDNIGKSYIGSFLRGMGFTFDDAGAERGVTKSLHTMEKLIASNPKNAERIRPYIGGEEVNGSPTHRHHRYVIDFDSFPLKRDNNLGSWLDLSERQKNLCITSGTVP